MFACKSGKHLLSEWICDNIEHCPGGEDENKDLCGVRTFL